MSTTTPNKITPTPPIYFVVKSWAEVTGQEVHDFLKIRSDVFIVEQDTVYPDIDGKDYRSIHVMGYIDNPLTQKQEMVAYCRVFKKGDYFDSNSCVGRVVVATQWRAYGYGHYLLNKGIEVLLERFTMPCVISAQLYLCKFYTSHGFKQMTEQYLEDNIPHIEMLLQEEDLTGDNARFIGKCKYDTPDGLRIERIKTMVDDKQEETECVAVIQD
jgi:ElaA protein